MCWRDSALAPGCRYLFSFRKEVRKGCVVTKVQIATTGKDAVELLEQVDQLMISKYYSAITDKGFYEIEQHINVFGFEILIQELLSIVMDYGPDTFYSLVAIRAHRLNFKCFDMGI